MLSEYEVDEKKRTELMREIVGVPRRLLPEAEADKIPRWAPAWWHGDDDATAANMAAMRALKRG